MAYTYDDFVKAAGSAGNLNRFSEEELGVVRSNPEYGLSMVKLYQEGDAAKTAEQKLINQESINQLRKSYGTYQYGGDNRYQQLLGEVTNPQSFTYDQNTDPQWSAYRKEYLREADRARADTLAKLAAGNGGVASSYAATAAQQAGDYYKGQLADKIPTLYQNALDQYYADQGLKLDALDALNADRNFDYQKYLEQQEKDYMAAQLLAQQGDYSLLAQYLNLTPEQLALLQGDSGNGGYYGNQTDDNRDASISGIGGLGGKMQALMSGSKQSVIDALAKAFGV